MGGRGGEPVLLKRIPPRHGQPAVMLMLWPGRGGTGWTGTGFKGDLPVQREGPTFSLWASLARGTPSP